MSDREVLPGAAGEQTHQVVAEPEAGRLDRYLAGLALGLSRARLQRLIADGRVTVDQARVRPSHRLHGGERIQIRVPPPRALAATPQDLPVEVLYEDRWLIAVAKPRGLVVHPAPGHSDGTLVNALLHHCRNLSGIGGVLRPGIVHRLDKDTSGVVLVAKDDATHRALQRQFATRLVHKRYLAVVVGRLAGSGVVDRPVGRHPTDRKRMAVDAPRARAAVSRWQVLQELRGATLVEVTIETGRTHQIRVHLASLGHPVVGDPVYGGTRRARGVHDPGTRRRLEREDAGQALHAWRLGFRHPTTGTDLDIVAPLPAGLGALITDLGGTPPDDAGP